jgi:hypothetical protein
MSKFDATLVLRGIDNDRFVTLMEANPDWSTMARSDLSAELEKLQDFVRQISYGNVDDPQTAAADLMDEMGWA